MCVSYLVIHKQPVPFTISSGDDQVGSWASLSDQVTLTYSAACWNDPDLLLPLLTLVCGILINNSVAKGEKKYTANSLNARLNVPYSVLSTPESQLIEPYGDDRKPAGRS